MEFTLKQFNEDANQLLEAFSNDVPAKNSFALSRWKLEGEGHSVYLSHPSIVTYHEISSLDDKEEEDELLSLEDSEIFLDPQQYSSNPQGSEKEPIQWDFSIIYSEAYRAPVLYFRVQTLEGSPCGRSKVLDLLPKQAIIDSWDFVSQEEHPFLGSPYFFLHPCQTNSRLSLVMMGSDGENICILWTWMSMVLPAIGQPIPSSYFKLVQNQLGEKKP